MGVDDSKGTEVATLILFHSISAWSALTNCLQGPKHRARCWELDYGLRYIHPVAFCRVAIFRGLGVGYKNGFQNLNKKDGFEFIWQRERRMGKGEVLGVRRSRSTKRSSVVEKSRPLSQARKKPECRAEEGQDKEGTRGLLELDYQGPSSCVKDSGLYPQNQMMPWSIYVYREQTGVAGEQSGC